MDGICIAKSIFDLPSTMSQKFLLWAPTLSVSKVGLWWSIARPQIFVALGPETLTTMHMLSKVDITLCRKVEWTNGYKCLESRH